MRSRDTEITAVLRAHAMDACDGWTTGYMGPCPLTGRRMYLTEAAARRSAIRAALARVGVVGDDADRIVGIESAAVTGRTDGAHAPTAKAHGGTRIVLTDADAQQAIGDADTLGTDDAPSIDTRTVRGVASAKRRVSEARRRLR